MAYPKWNAKQQKWIYRPYIEGKQCKFESRVRGKKGSDECYEKEKRFREGKESPIEAKIGSLWGMYEEYIRRDLGEFSSTYCNIKSNGKHHILPICKNKRLDQMSTMDWQNIITYARPVAISRVRTETKELSKKSLMRIREAISGFLKWCRKNDLTEKNPDLEIPRGRIAAEQKNLTTEEIKFLIKGIETSISLIHAFRLQLVLGLRPGEVLGLKMDDIEGKFLHIQRAINTHGLHTKGKNFNANRYEFLFPIAHRIIDEQLFKRKSLMLESSPWLFPAANGKPETQKRYRECLKVLCREQGWQEITPYWLRKGFASVMAGRMDIEKLKKIMGHSEYMDTLGVYDTGLKENQQEAGEAAGKVWETVLRA